MKSKHDLLLEFMGHARSAQAKQLKKDRRMHRRRMLRKMIARVREFFTWEIVEANSSDNSTIC